MSTGETVRGLVADIGVKLICLAVLAGQSAFLDHVLIHYGQGTGFKRGYEWIIIDVIVFVFWLSAFMASRRQAGQPIYPLPKTKQDLFYEFPFAYSCWLVYACVFVAKVIRIIHNIDVTGIHEGIFSPIVLKIAVSLSSILFLLLAYSHHEGVEKQEYKLQVQKLGTMASLAMLDSADLLDMIVTGDQEHILPYHVRAAIVAFGCICFIIPTIPLFALRFLASKQPRYPSQPKPKNKKKGNKDRRDSEEQDSHWEGAFLLKSVLFLLLVDIPFFAIRFHLWLQKGMTASVFLTKNLLMLVRALLDLVSEVPQCTRNVKRDRPLLELGMVVRINKD
ncbi:cat eye syndrome critical region protein 6 homolog [Acanthaster planci]|uniref:Cat eye syndrome critical region protein 6 homolog n=1 Tax=Acanthaster planci TaxID=133434 RepID=A0A8B7XWX6_ACAPL|nr:cat eye syndrome critical region protein 6 homolog [Acanthaster planci]